jgi:hypothetical protein
MNPDHTQDTKGARCEDNLEGKKIEWEETICTLILDRYIEIKNKAKEGKFRK